MALTPAVMFGMSLTPVQVLAQGSETSPATGRQSEGAESAQRFAIAAQPLASALDRFSEQTGISFAYATSQLKGARSSGVTGEMTARQALARLLAGTGVTFQFTSADTVTLATAGAQDGDGPLQLGPITVEGMAEPQYPVEGYKADFATTATRSRLPIKETPSSIGVVTDDLIEDTFSRSQGDALEAVSGVSRDITLIGRSEGLTIRGFQVNNFGGDFNGLKENGLPTDGNFAPDAALIERYEVLKGPSSIVGGASEPGGVINRIMKTPQRETFATLEAQGGSFGLKRGVADLNSVAFENARLRGRLIVAAEDGGEFVDDIDARQITIAPSAELDLFDGSGTLLLSGRYQEFDGSSYPGFPFLANGDAPDISRTRNIGGGSANGASTEFSGGNAQIEYEHNFLSGLTLSAKGRYEISDNEGLDIYAYRYGGVPVSGATNIYAGFRESEWENYSGELFVSKVFTAFDREHELLAGIDHRDQTNKFLNSYQYLGTDNIFNPANNFRAPSEATLRANPSSGSDVTLEQTGMFGQLVVRPVERLTVVGAFRHDWASTRRLNKINNTVQESDPTSFTGRIGATVELTPWLNVYGGYQESFEPNAFAVTVGGELIEPETGQNYEVGAKFDAFDGRLGGSLALFRTYRQNVATGDPANPGFSIATGEQRHQGIEFDLNGEPISGLRLSGNFSFLDAEVTQSNTGTEGFTPIFAPVDYVGRIWSTYTFQSGSLKDFGFGGGVFFHSGYHLDGTDTVTSDAYERVDAVAFYRPVENVEVRLNIRNLTDATYVESPGLVTGYNSFGAPLSVFGSVKVRF